MSQVLSSFFEWKLQVASSPTQLWPHLSDTNKLFKHLQLSPAVQTPVSRSLPDGFLELAHSKLNSYVNWEEEPFAWEKPYRFGVTRRYKAGLLRHIRFTVDLNPNKNGTLITVRIWFSSASRFANYILNIVGESYLKRRLTAYIRLLDQASSRELSFYEVAPSKWLKQKPLPKKAEPIRDELIKRTKRHRIVNRLYELLSNAEAEDLGAIHPYQLAETWGEKKYAVLNVFLHAAKLDLLDFYWSVTCPTCSAQKISQRKLEEVRPVQHCENCDASFELDFNRNLSLVFTPNPLIRKLPQRQYCFGGPFSKPHVFAQQYLGVGEQVYVKVKLEEGTYLFKSSETDGFLKLYVRKDCEEDTFNLILSDEPLGEESVTISTKPNLIISNRSSRKRLCYIKKRHWGEEAIMASEVTSAYDFRSLFGKEIIREGDKMKANGLTVLFTDLMNSTELYQTEGDETAIGHVMSHFKIIQQIVAEERGGIVKTIGDSVMAVFPEPVSSLKALKRIQQIFSNSSAFGDSFKLKAGIHFGNCTVVNLNNRIDYFGTTVNIASRLVDLAKEKEVIVSEAVFRHPDVQLFISKNRDTLFLKESLRELKGFEDKEFKIQQIRLERPPLRLVI
ncbi:MAG: adenylate/guanylate cyclase domain-containing protein [Bacteroidota bacterium]